MKISSLVESNPQEDNNEDDSGSSLVPGLPDEIALYCLLHLPFPHQTLIRSVSSSWNKAVTDPNFLFFKKTFSLSLPYVFVLAFHRSTAKLQWQAFNPRTGCWFLLPSMPGSVPVCPPGFACTSLPEHGLLFVLGGMRSDTETPLQTVVVYSASTNQWSLGSPMLTPRSFFAAGSIGGKIFVAGGSKGGLTEEEISAVECYDPDKNRWCSVANMHSGLASYDVAVIGKKMYVTEGWTWPYNFRPRGGVYDSGRDTWQEMSCGMGEGWTGMSFVLDGRLFVISEHEEHRLMVYVPDRDTWEHVVGGKFPGEAVQRPFSVSAAEGELYVVSCGLNVVIGRVAVDGSAEGETPRVEWKVVGAPKSFCDLVPTSAQLLYA